MGVRRERSPIAGLVESSGTDQIIEKATRLFAERGYHGVTTRHIAVATGLNAATIQRHVGTKRHLYRTVVERLYREDRALIEAWPARLPSVMVDNVAGARDVVRRLLDRVFQRIVAGPMSETQFRTNPMAPDNLARIRLFVLRVFVPDARIGVGEQR